MFALSLPSLLKSTDPKLFGENLQKIMEHLYLFTEKSGISIFCAI